MQKYHTIANNFADLSQSFNKDFTPCNLQTFAIAYIVKAKAKIEAKVEQSLRLRPRLRLDRGQRKDSVQAWAEAWL